MKESIEKKKFPLQDFSKAPLAPLTTNVVLLKKFSTKPLKIYIYMHAYSMDDDRRRFYGKKKNEFSFESSP